jgi:hypothetical protein
VKQAESVSALLNAWNDLDIIAMGNLVTVSLNGKRVAEYTDATGWFGSGAIGLNVWGTSTVQFKEVLIQELPGDGKQGMRPANHLQPGSAWEGTWTFEDPGMAGEQHPYRFIVTERSGDRFKAESVFGSAGVRGKVEGTIQGDQIEYEDTGEKPHHFSMTGRIQASQVKFRFQGAGGQGNPRFGKGQVTLQEK